MSQTDPLTEEEVKYFKENQKSLQIAVENCYILFDPKKTESELKMLKFIDSQPNDRLYVYLFISNTCEIVEGLTPAHITGICQFYKVMTDEQLQYFSKLIQDAFFTPIDVKTSGFLEFIWNQLMEGCMTKITNARGGAQTTDAEIPLPSQNLEQVAADQGITEQPEAEIVEL